MTNKSADYKKTGKEYIEGTFRAFEKEEKK